MRALRPSTSLRVALFGLGTLFACGGEAPELRHPNVVLISIDSLRADRLGCYGHDPYGEKVSPAIDGLAANGVRFETAISSTSWTLPSHAAMLTGLYDSAHGLNDNGLSLGDDHATLAEVLKDNGYATAGFFGGPYLHPTYGFGQGFDHYQSCMTALEDGMSGDAVRAQSGAKVALSHGDVTSPRTLLEVDNWLDGASTDRPFFLFIHLWDVHYDFIPPPEYVERFDPGYVGPIDGRNFMEDDALMNPQMPERDLRHLMALYDAEIRFTDDHIGRILGSMRVRGMLENTVVIVTADHGEEFFEHGGKGHQKTLFDEVVRVPLVVSWEGTLEPRVVPDQVRTIDLMPTILTLAGIRSQPAVMGRDLSPLLLGRPLPEEPALSELHVDRGGRSAMRALRTNDHKTVVPDFPPAKPYPPVGFDLRADPGEQRMQPGTPRVRADLSEIDRLVRACADAKARVGRATRAIEIDPEIADRLRELGYTDGEAEPEDR